MNLFRRSLSFCLLLLIALHALAFQSAAVERGTQVQPAPLIDGYSLGETELRPTSKVSQDEIVLEPTHPNVAIFFSTQLSSPQPIRYRYRLEGYDTDWTVTNSPVAHYRRLPPGNHRFVVQASSNSEWGSTTAAVTVRRRPFFYQTWYFYCIVAFCFIVLIVQLLHQRDLLFKGQMGIVLEERNRIARDCHDTLLAGFAAISWQLEATSKLLVQSSSTDSAAAQSCDLARSMVAHCQEEARRIIWDLRDSDEMTNTLSQALVRAIAAQGYSDTIAISMDVEGEEIAIAPGAVHHLVCIGQESISNSIRHGEASTIDVRLRYEEGSLNLSIRDNGRGLQATDLRRAGHFGIAVMHERARKLGGALHISSNNSGTEVILNVMFHVINRPVSEQNVVPWVGV
jgi:signal transduction histidine kinase